MADSALKRLIVQTSHYGVVSVLNMVAGLVTFPLITRIFSVEEYGLMNLVAATLMVSVAVGKLGVQHSILRYHSEIVAGKSRYSLPQLYSTTLLGLLAAGLAVALLLSATAQLIPERWLGDPRLRLLFAIASLLIIAQVVESGVVNFLRAEQRTATMMKYQIAKKYLGVGLIVVTVLLIRRSLAGFYVASVIGDTVALGVLAFLLLRKRERPRLAMAEVSGPLYQELLRFGIPMMVGYEISGIILSVGDRYVIEGLIGEAPLGLYSAAYNLCQYIQAIAITSVGQAIMPIYMQMWDQKGPEATSFFISKSLRTYALFGAPVIAGLAAVGPELLPYIASEKYASASPIVPWVIAGMVVDGTTSMLGAGLFIHRKTRLIMIIVLSCALLNIALNLVLVPRIGILGAAVATLVSYAGTALMLAVASRKLLPVALPWATLFRAGLAAGVMYAGVIYLYPGERLLTVGVRAAVGAPIYGGIMLLIDPDARGLLSKLLGRFRKKAQP